MNAKTTKRALFSSVLAIVLCLAMLIGTTFAWFTDTASTGVNKITSGNLKMKVEYSTDMANWTEVSADKAVFDENTLWEPGHVEFVVLKVENVGTLALKYKLGINIASETGSTNVNGKEFKLSDYINFAVIDGDATTTTTTTADARDALLTAAGDGQPINKGYNPDAISLGVDENKIVTLVVWMPTTVGNDANHATDADAPVINLGIDVVATQDTVENDSFGTDYDESAPLDFVPVSSAEELKAAFANVEAGEDVNVSLTADVTISDNAFSALNGGTEVGDITIQGNGHTLTNNNVNSVRGLQIANSTAARTVTISNVNLKLTGTETNGNANGKYENRGVQLFGLGNATINLVNCNIDMTATNCSYAVKVIKSKDLTINITGCTLTSANCIEVTNDSSNCTFNISGCLLTSNYNLTSDYAGGCINNNSIATNIYKIKNTTFAGNGAQPFSEMGESNCENLGGNVNNTGNQQVEWFN